MGNIHGINDAIKVTLFDVINIRDEIGSSVWYKVGNGKNTSLWFDNWCDLGPLFRIISNRSMYSANLQRNMMVADMVSNDKWNWPTEWNTIWKVVKDMMQFQSNVTYCEDIVDELAGKPNGNSIWSIVRRLCLATIVYAIWRERNCMIFREEGVSWEVILEKICETSGLLPSVMVCWIWLGYHSSRLLEICRGPYTLALRTFLHVLILLVLMDGAKSLSSVLCKHEVKGFTYCHKLLVMDLSENRSFTLVLVIPSIRASMFKGWDPLDIGRVFFGGNVARKGVSSWLPKMLCDRLSMLSDIA
ncbi:hypothetical protein Tco_0931875 [Tanacetum coccineum]